MFIQLKTLIKLAPTPFRDRYRSTWNKIRLEIGIIISKIIRQIIRPSVPRLEDGSVNLHLGCGPVDHPKFINIDGLPSPHIHYVRAIDNLSVFKDNTIDLIYACHCLEHFSYLKVPMVLKEWHRVLKKGGKLRVSVPDFDLLLAIYNDNEQDMNAIIGPLLGGQNYKYNFHLVAFNPKNLENYFKQAGFTTVYKWHPGIDEMTTFDDYSNFQLEFNNKRYSVSLNLEAVK